MPRTAEEDRNRRDRDDRKTKGTSEASSTGRRRLRDMPWIAFIDSYPYCCACEKWCGGKEHHSDRIAQSGWSKLHKSRMEYYEYDAEFRKDVHDRVAKKTTRPIDSKNDDRQDDHREVGVKPSKTRPKNYRQDDHREVGVKPSKTRPKNYRQDDHREVGVKPSKTRPKKDDQRGHHREVGVQLDVVRPSKSTEERASKEIAAQKKRQRDEVESLGRKVQKLDDVSKELSTLLKFQGENAKMKERKAERKQKEEKKQIAEERQQLRAELENVKKVKKELQTACNDVRMQSLVAELKKFTKRHKKLHKRCAVHLDMHKRERHMLVKVEDTEEVETIDSSNIVQPEKYELTSSNVVHQEKYELRSSSVVREEKYELSSSSVVRQEKCELKSSKVAHLNGYEFKSSEVAQSEDEYGYELSPSDVARSEDEYGYDLTSDVAQSEADAAQSEADAAQSENYITPSTAMTPSDDGALSPIDYATIIHYPEDAYFPSNTENDDILAYGVPCTPSFSNDNCHDMVGMLL
eukprot:GEMP01003740.1.p1 GENE.GEMP01003740.1~~GEMP01003740.1.p1  ORF type:complete len:541 (-),score=157.36 GEMP01003740.1:2774-4333(-)